MSHFSGPIANNSQIILGVGSDSGIAGLLVHHGVMEIVPILIVNVDHILELVLQHEPFLNGPYPQRYHFSLIVPGKGYLGVTPDNRHEVSPVISKNKTIFWVTLITINEIMANTSYPLYTRLNKIEYPVKWKSKLSPSGFIKFLPTSWIERDQDLCRLREGKIELVTRIKTHALRGYTTKAECRQAKTLVAPSTSMVTNNTMTGISILLIVILIVLIVLAFTHKTRKEER
jgi:hypothetical protein